MAKYTQRQVEKIIASINSSFTVESEYVNNTTPLLLRHSKCEKTFERNINSFKKSQKCPNCEGGRNNWNTNRVADYIKEHTNSEYCLVGEYIHYKSYISVLHKKCGHEYKVTFDAFKSGNRCPSCGIKKRADSQRKSTIKFKEEIAKLTNSEFEVVSDYNGAFRTVDFKHKKCGKKFKKIAHNFLQKPSCPNCGGFSIWETTEYNEHITELTGGEYGVVGEYISDKKGKTTFIHFDCGKEFDMLASNFTSGDQRCPHCKPNTSKAELKIRGILNDLGIQFEEQFRFVDCKDKATLPFDFAIINNGNLVGLLEYDGVQHFRGWGANKKDLENIKRRDKIKNDYCKEKNIPLVRITYREYSNIETKVKEAIDWIQQQNTQIESSLGIF
ncbi:TPA: hypothetical protein ACGO6G_000949 [Streptococcus suis]